MPSVRWTVGLVVVAAISLTAWAPPAIQLLPLIPKPADLKIEPGALSLDGVSSRRLRDFCANDHLGRQPWVSELAKPMATAGRNVISRTPPMKIDILSLLTRYGDEGYRLAISSTGIAIEARTPAGAFYGAQTLCQLVPADGPAGPGAAPPATITLPALVITDAPRFRWRGMHLDVSRHFFTKDEIKRYLDMLARFKFNVFHWHLVDDGGWRIEIKKFPRLTEVGAWRRQTPEMWSFEKLDFPGPGTGETLYGGFYTQQDVRDIVAYATDRHITIVPEIEMPGHCVPALFAYPELMCANTPPLPGRAYKSTVMCPGKESTFAFLEGVLDEVMQLFPSQHIHIGGDEVDRKFWTDCPDCRKRMQDEGLTDVAQLQSYTIRRVASFLKSRGRTLVGWDEILDGGLAPNAVVMSWRGTAGGIAAAKAGHDVVMSPTSHCYFDYPYAATSTERVYQYDPVPADLSPEQEHFVLGAQGNVWTESIPDFARVETMVLPRMLALAEVLWSPKAGRTFSEFETRLNFWYPRFDIVSASYYFPAPEANASVVVFADRGDLILTPSTVPGVSLRYTVDGSDPVAGSTAYSTPVSASGDLVLTAAFFGSRGRLGDPVRIVARKVKRAGASNLIAGLSYARFSVRIDKMADLSNLEADAGGVQAEPSILSIDPGKPFAAVWKGMLRISIGGTYTFTLGSDDGSLLKLYDAAVVDNDGPHAYLERSGNAVLTAGDHPLEIAYFNTLGDRSLNVFIEGPGLTRQKLPASMLFHAGR